MWTGPGRVGFRGTASGAVSGGPTCSAEGGSREGRAAGSPKPFPRALLSTWKPRLGPNQGEAEEGLWAGWERVRELEALQKTKPTKCPESQ